MTCVYGFALIYGIPAVLAFAFWLLVRRAVAYWVHRDLMLSLIPKAVHVHHTERLLGIRTRIK